MLDDFEASGLARHRMPPVAAHHEIGAHLDLTAVVAGKHADDALSVPKEVHRFMLHQQLKGWKPLGMVGKEVQEIPLGHERDKFALRGDVAEVSGVEGGISEDDSHRLDLLMGQLEELLSSPSSARTSSVEG